MNKELADQTNNAFDFVQKLYFEISYLIKELENILRKEEEFVIVRPQGYGITARSSTGLEPESVEQWMVRNCTVFFIPEAMTEVKRGQTYTNFKNDLKVLFLHIELIDREIKEPRVLLGCITNIKSKRSSNKKFEHLAWEFSYNNKKIFRQIPNIDYEDSVCSFKGKSHQDNLFSISSSNDIRKRIIEPMLELYRK